MAADELADVVVYDPTCTPCVLTLPHAHPDGRAPLWPCVHCHNRQCAHCDGAYQFCNCYCEPNPRGPDHH